MSIQTQIGMPIDEFIRRYDEAPFELIDGEVIPKMPTVSGHNRLSKRFFVALLPFEQQGFGEVFQEATYVLADSSQWVKNSRIPDVMFVSAAKLEQFKRDIPDAENKPYILVPDIVIDIVSPTDQYSEISRRVKRYLSDGVPLILIVDPETRERGASVGERSAG
ncbi:MAG: Uma2 family endonuclease [Chloroflexota bacterium]